MKSQGERRLDYKKLEPLTLTVTLLVNKLLLTAESEAFHLTLSLCYSTEVINLALQVVDFAAVVKTRRREDDRACVAGLGVGEALCGLDGGGPFNLLVCGKKGFVRVIMTVNHSQNDGCSVLD